MLLPRYIFWYVEIFSLDRIFFLGKKKNLDRIGILGSNL